jgi:hypothetical protein
MKQILIHSAVISLIGIFSYAIIPQILFLFLKGDAFLSIYKKPLNCAFCLTFWISLGFVLFGESPGLVMFAAPAITSILYK